MCERERAKEKKMSSRRRVRSKIPESDEDEEDSKVGAVVVASTATEAEVSTATTTTAVAATSAAAAAGSSSLFVVPDLCDVGKVLLEDVMDEKETAAGDDFNKLVQGMERLYQLMIVDRDHWEPRRRKVNIKTVYDLGGHVIIISKMKKYVMHAGVQRLGCCCLSEIASLLLVHNNNNANENEYADINIIKAGGIEAIVNALKCHEVQMKMASSSSSSSSKNTTAAEEEEDEDHPCSLLYLEGFRALDVLTQRLLRNFCNLPIVEKVSNRLVGQYDIISIVNDTIKHHLNHNNNNNNFDLMYHVFGLLSNLSGNDIVRTKNKLKLFEVVGSVGMTLQSYGQSLYTPTAGAEPTSDDEDYDYEYLLTLSQKRKRDNNHKMKEIIKKGGYFMKKMFPSS